MEYVILVAMLSIVGGWYLWSNKPSVGPQETLEAIVDSYIGEFELFWVDTPHEFQSMIADLLSYDVVSLDTETAVQNERKLNVLMLARTNRVYVVDPLVLEIDLLLLQPVFDSCALVFHNASFDIKIVQECGLVVRRYFDTMVLSKQLKKTKGHSIQDMPKSNGLKECSEHFLGIPIPKMTLEEHDEWHMRPLTKKQMHYSALDAEATLRLAEIFAPQGAQAKPFGSKRDIAAHEWDTLQLIRTLLASHIHPLRIFCTVQATQVKFFVDAASHDFAKIKNQKGVPMLFIGSSQPILISEEHITQHVDELLDSIHNA